MVLWITKCSMVSITLMKWTANIGFATMHILDVTVTVHGIALMEPTKLTVLPTHVLQTVIFVYYHIAITSLAYPYLESTTVIWIV